MKRLFLTAPLILLALLCLNFRAWSEDSDLQKQLNLSYVDKVLTLRHFYEGDHLKFRSDGTLVGDAAIGPWTLDGQIHLREIHLNEKTIAIKCRRVQVVFENKGDLKHPPKPIDELQTIGDLSGKERDDLEKRLWNMEVNVEIELAASNPTEQDISSAIHAVFFMPGESIAEAVPDYWRSYLATLDGRPFTPRSTVKPILAVDPHTMSPPHATLQPEPEYSTEGRKSKRQGTTVVWLVIDAAGTPRDFQIWRPLGLGLDEKAIEAISGWKFDPAKKDGEPVATVISIEIEFRLY